MPVRRFRRARAPVRRRVARRRTSVRRRRTISRTPRRQIPRSLTKYELAQVNPFDKQVNGVKIPDSNTMPSDTAYSEDRFTITSAATDLAKAVAFFPTVAAYAQAAVDSTSTAWTWSGFGGTASSNLTSFQNSYVGIRVCGHGVRLSSQLAPTSATGFVHIAIYPIDTFSQIGQVLPLNLSQMSQLSWYRRLTLASLTQRSCTVVNKFIDSGATRYFNPGTDLMATGSDMTFQYGAAGWCAIVIAVEGAPLSSSVLSVENLVHYETLQLRSASGSQSPAAEFNVRELEDVSRIAGQGNAIFLEGEEPGQIRQAASILSRGVRAIGNYVTPQSLFTTYTGGGIQGVNTGRLMN